MKQSNSLHLAFALILLLVGIGVIVALVIMRSQTQTETATTTLTVTNIAPSVDNLKLCSGSGDPVGCSQVTDVNLTAASTTTYAASGSISDQNGFSDIVEFEFEFYRAGIGNCISADDNNCYLGSLTGTDCTLTQDTDIAGFFDCPIALAYHAEATDNSSVSSEGAFPADQWSLSVTATDNAAATDTVSENYEVNALRAIGTSTGNACASIAYGEITNGAATSDSSAAGTDCVLTNDGNVDTDITEKAGHMSCTFGGIATTNQRVNTTSGTYAAMATGGTDLSSSDQTIDLVLDKSSGSVSQDSLFHAISVPSSGASGTCQGVNTIVAVSEV